MLPWMPGYLQSIFKKASSPSLHSRLNKIESRCDQEGTGEERDDKNVASSPSHLGTTHAQPPLIVINGIATGVPEFARTQSESVEAVASLFHKNPEQQERIKRVYSKTGIDTRHMAVDPLDPDYDRTMLIRQRMNLFLEHATPLATRVCSRVLTQCGVDNMTDIKTLVVVTSTGFIAPGIDLAIIKALKLSPEISRVVVSFMGCAAAMNGLRVAANSVRAYPGSKALVCCIEMSSVNAVFADNLNDVIISSLFADGCAAMVVGSSSASEERLEPGTVIIRDQFHHLIDDTDDGITLGINPDGVTCELSPNLPSYIYAGLAPVIQKVLARQGMRVSDLHLWAIHPGGPKIIEESVRSLGLNGGVAAKSWDVLREFGNMLSASLPFVLERMIRETQERELSKGVAFSFAPGVSVEGMLFDIVGK